MQDTQTIGTPNAIWTWMCDDCTVQRSEAYLTDSPGVDGGAFDIDYGNTKNSVIDNYGHDTQGYCVAVFGAGFVTQREHRTRQLVHQQWPQPAHGELPGRDLSVDVEWRVDRWADGGEQHRSTGVHLRMRRLC